MSTSASAEDDGDQEKAESTIPGATKLLECFIEKMQKYDSNFERTPSTDLFVFDVITNPNNDKAIPRLDEDAFRAAFCKSALVKPYKPLYRRSKAQRVARSKGTLGPLGGLWIETESPFIDSFYNLTGREAWGHSDITGDALSILLVNHPEFKLTQGGNHFLKHASQVPDLYHWKDEVFHAHTPSEEDNNYIGKSKLERITAGKELFKTHVRDHMRRFLQELSLNNVAGALLALGTVSHGVQDLVYHHGITLGQHAGLAYAGGFENPDYPNDKIRPIIQMEARTNTSLVLKTARTYAGDCGWRKIQDWEGLGGKSADDRSKKFWKHMSKGNLRQDIGYFSLISYYGMADPYRKGNPKRKELEDASEIIDWRSNELIKDIIDYLKTDEQIRAQSDTLNKQCKT